MMDIDRFEDLAARNDIDRSENLATSDDIDRSEDLAARDERYRRIRGSNVNKEY